MKTPRVLSNGAGRLLACCALILSSAPARAQSLLITTLAGAPGWPGSSDGTGAGARFSDPKGVAIDAAGNLYVADTYNDTVRKITPGGVVTTLAGTPGMRGSADGTGSSASFSYPAGVALDAAGNLYVSDNGNSTIRKITAAGAVTTFAGTAQAVGSIDGTGAGAQFNSPWGVAVDAAGNVYVADTGNSKIRMITPAGVVTTLAGNGVSGSSDGEGSAAQFNRPQGVAVDASGNVYVADTVNLTIRMITPEGVVSTLAGAAGAWGAMDGTGSSAHFDDPGALAVDAAGNIYVADSGNDTIRKVTPMGVVTTLAGSVGASGTADGTGSSARFWYPQGICADAAGDIFVADSDNNMLRKGVASGVPSIGTPPVSQTASVGNTVTFSVAASSATAVTYQWSFNGAPIAGATAATYTTRPVQLSDEGLYSAAVSNSAGTALAAASLTATFIHDATYSFSSWTPSNPLPGATTYVAVAYDGTHFLAVGLDGTAFSSADGVAWTASATNGPPGQAWGELNSVVNVPGKNMLVAVGNGGAVVTYASGSYDGTLQSSGSASILTGVAAGNGSLVAVGYGGTCIVSDLTASSWKASTTGISQNLNAIAYGDGRFVAVGLAGTVATSPDGVTWSAQQLGSKDNLYGVVFGENGLVAVGDNGGIFTSPDGVLWLQQNSHTSAVLVHAGYGDGIFVAIGFLGTVLTSADGGATWTSNSSGTLARLDGVALGKDSFVLVGTGGVKVQSGAATPSRLVNLSARSTVGAGANMLIAGFVINGSGSKQILLRGIGPTLGQFGVSESLAEPHLDLMSSAGGALASNSVWGGGAALAQAFADLGAFPLASGSADSALLQTLGASPYTAQLSGLSGTSGVGLAEIYDADTGTPAARLINISARASVGVGSNILIAGFVISGNTPERVLIRGIGPALGQFGVSGPLATPQLVVYDSGNNALQTNSGWGGGADLVQAFAQVGAFPLAIASADAAILVTLPPGAYTAELSGAGGATGVGLAEIYEAP